MDNLFDSDSWIMVKLSELGDLIVLNLLYILTSLPILTLGASTTALYTVLRGPEGGPYTSSVFKNYFKAFFQNFKKSTLILLVLLIPAAIIGINLYILLVGLLEGSILNYILCALPIVIFLFAWNYVFPLTAKFENSIGKTLTNALLLSVAHLPSTIVMTVLNLLPWAMLFFFTNFFYRTLIIWILLAFSLIAKVNSILLRRIFARYAETPAA